MKGLVSFAFTAAAFGLVFLKKRSWALITEPRKRDVPQFPSTLLQFLAADSAVWLHANRRRCEAVEYNWLRLHREQEHGGFTRCVVTNGGDFYVYFRDQFRLFDRKGRLLSANYRIWRFELQRMCRRLVTRTRCRFLCRKHVDPYLIPELRDVVLSYI